MEDYDLRHQVKALEKERNELQKKCEWLERELEKRGVTDAPRILKLQKELDEIKHNYEGQSALCTSLSQESEVLKRKLAETVATCQELLQKLNESKSSEADQRPVKAQPRLNGSKRITLQTQINDLEAELREVVVENTQWEENYMRQRQQIDRLKGELRGTTNRETQSSAALQSNRPQDVEHRAQMEQLFDKYKQKLARLEQDRLQIDAENAQLKAQLERLQQQEQAMQQRQEESLVSQSESLPSTDPQEQLDLLRHQAQLYLEDFKSERRDRERAQSQIAELESEVQILRTQVLEEQAKHRRSHSPRQEYGRDEFDGNSAMQYRTRGPVMRTESQDECDGQSSQTKLQSNAARFSPPNAHNSSLQCPKCNQLFTATDDFGLLKHVSECMVD